MGRVFIFGMAGLIVLGLIAGGISVIGGSAKLTSLFWRKRKGDSE